MGETCDVCGRPKEQCDVARAPEEGDYGLAAAVECYRLGYERMRRVHAEWARDLIVQLGSVANG